MIDNIDLGKTHEYFKWVAKQYAGPGRVKGRPRFVMSVGPLSSAPQRSVLTHCRKADDDVSWSIGASTSHDLDELTYIQTVLVMPNIISAFKDLDCRTNVYWGTSAGRSHYFGDYFRGLAYAMSWPLV